MIMKNVQIYKREYFVTNSKRAHFSITSRSIINYNISIWSSCVPKTFSTKIITELFIPGVAHSNSIVLRVDKIKEHRGLTFSFFI